MKGKGVRREAGMGVGEVEVRRLEPLERLGDRCAPAGSARAAGAGSGKDLRVAPARRAYRMNRLNPRWFKMLLRARSRCLGRSRALTGPSSVSCERVQRVWPSVPAT